MIRISNLANSFTVFYTNTNSRYNNNNNSNSLNVYDAAIMAQSL